MVRLEYMSTLKWGILGPGRIARKFCRAVVECDDQQVAAVGSRSRDRGEAFAREFGISAVFEDYEELITSEEVDAIYVATPHAFHYEQALRVLEAGKAVLVEKPITVTASQMEKLMNAARKSNSLLMEAMWTRCLPAVQQLKIFIQEETLGKWRFLQADFGFCYSGKPEDRLLNPDLAGGSLLDLGVYPIAFGLFLTDRAPLRVSSEMVMSSTGVDGMASFQCEFAGEIILQGTSAINAHLSKVATLGFERGTVEVPEFWAAQGYTVRPADEEPEEVSLPHAVNGFEYQLEAFRRAWVEDRIECPDIPWEASLAALRIMDEIRKTHEFEYPFEMMGGG